MDGIQLRSISQILDAIEGLPWFAPEAGSQAVWRDYAAAAYDLARIDGEEPETALVDRASRGDAATAVRALHVLKYLGAYAGSFRDSTFDRLAGWSGDEAADAAVREAALEVLLWGDFPLIEPSGLATILSVLVDPRRRPAGLPRDLEVDVARQAGGLGDRLVAHGEFAAGKVTLEAGLLDGLFDPDSPDSLLRHGCDPARREAVGRMIVESSRVPPPLRFPSTRRRGTRSHRLREVHLWVPALTLLRPVSLVVVWAESRGRYARHAADAFIGLPGDRPDVLSRVRRRHGWLADQRRTYRNPSAAAPT